ncbi:flagella [Thermococcus henrietii]|uniref:flagella n=1 Tax=Thermococcus henrietii TaxID=2016361 RepID=UPI000C08A014|nr:flagella [Thermococcus henrietii]
MGFSVSASAAIIFISFLMMAGTLYTAWDNAYANVQAAREYWYNLKLSQLNTLSSLNAKNSSVSTGTTYYNITLAIRSNGITLYVPHWSGTYDGKLVTLYNVNDDNVGFLSNYTYLLPGGEVLLNVTYIPLDSTHHTLNVVFGNGCWVRFNWYYNTTTNSVYVTTSRGCPTEVS